MTSRRSLPVLTLLLAAAPLCAAIPQQLPDFSRFAPAHSVRTVPETIDGQDRVTLRGNVPSALLQATPIGLEPASAPMEKMLLSLKMSPDAEYRLAQLTEAQQDPKSPYYHQWLTPEQFGQMFGPSQADVDAVVSWLMGQGFSIDEVAAGRTTITFSGNVAKVQQAFRTTIKTFDLDGAARYGNTTDPTIPTALAGVVNGIVSLHNIPRKSAINSVRRLSDEEAANLLATRRGSNPNYSGSGNTTHYMAPGDFAAIYNSKALYNASTPINGTGVTICIVGRANITTPADPATFRSDFGLSVNPPTIFYNGTKPAINDGEATEALLDMEWSGATAPGAAVKYISTKSGTSDGVDLSATYIVNHQSTVGSPAYHVSVMSTSFGSCEANMGSTELAFYNNLWSQAATEGISSFVSTGDSGAAGCDGGSATTGTGLGISGLASTPYNTAVGGTSFREGGNYATYWSTTNTNYASALGYIPETVWNESSGTTAPDGTAGSGLWSGSGGVSTTYAKPSWQVAPGVPADAHRDIPDISLNASSYDGPLIVQTPNGGAVGIYIVGGTSASSPAFAGLAALVVQKTGANQGNINPRLYQLAKAQYTGAGTLTAFHDTTTGNNSVPGVTGYSAGVGYDMASGLGSVDAAQLVNNWVDTTAPASVTASETGTSGTVTFNGSATDNIGVDHIDFLVDGTVKATASSSPFSATFDSTNLSNGSHTLVAKAYDAAGNNASSAGSPFSILNGITGTFDVLQSGHSVNNQTVSGTVTYSATAAAPSGIQRVTFYLDGKFYTSVYTPPYTAALDTTKLENGSHTLLAYAVDNSSTQAYLTPEHTYITTNNVDTLPPTGATVVSGGPAGNITFTTTAQDQSGIQRVTYYVDGKFYATVTTPPYTVVLDGTKLLNGTHSVLTYAVDNAGNLGYLDHGQPFTTNNPDTIPPTGSTTSSGTSGTITFTTSASDPSGIQRVTYYLDGQFYATVTSAPYGTTVDSTKLSNGTHYMLTYAVDGAGNLGYLDHGKAFTVNN